MARAAALDHLQTFRFSLRDAGDGSLVPVLSGTNGNVFDFGGGEEGGVGFASVTGLNMQAEVEEIKEGGWPFSHYVVHRASCSRVTLTRGILPRDSDFYNWFVACLFGAQYTRRNLQLSLRGHDGNTAKMWLLHQCLPTNVSPWPELNATSGDIAVATLEIQPAYVEELSV